MTGPNEIWTADFKGHFKTGDGLYCYPLTVKDGFSRYVFDPPAEDLSAQQKRFDWFCRFYRRVSRNGGIRWKNQWVCVTHVLAEEYVAFDEVDNGLGEIFYGPVRLGRFNERNSKIEDDQGRKYRKNVLPMSPDQSVASLSGRSKYSI